MDHGVTGNQQGGVRMGQATLVFQVSSKQDVTITSPPPNWVEVPVGTTVNHQLTATGGTQPLAWAVAGPPGMTINNAMLMWTPQTVMALRNITVTVTDAG